MLENDLIIHENISSYKWKWIASTTSDTSKTEKSIIKQWTKLEEHIQEGVVYVLNAFKRNKRKKYLLISFTILYQYEFLI